MWLRDILTQCAWSAARTRDTYLSAQFWRLARRIGKKKAAIAVGHSILVICWHLLTNDCDYDDLGGDYFPDAPTPTANATTSSSNSTASATESPSTRSRRSAAVDSLHSAGIDPAPQRSRRPSKRPGSTAPHPAHRPASVSR